MTLLPELFPIERLEDVASSARSAMSIATKLSKAGKLRRSGMLVESAFHRNIQPLQGVLVARGRVLFHSHAAPSGALGVGPEPPAPGHERPLFARDRADPTFDTVCCLGLPQRTLERPWQPRHPRKRGFLWEPFLLNWSLASHF